MFIQQIRENVMQDYGSRLRKLLSKWPRKRWMTVRRVVEQPTIRIGLWHAVYSFSFVSNFSDNSKLVLDRR
jgi:hypothetical protein